MNGVDEAVRYHSSGYSCSEAILCAYHDEAGLTEREAEKIAGPLSGGKKIKCGAVLAAEEVLKKKFAKDLAEQKIRVFEDRFTEMNKSVICRELRGLGGGPRLRSCRGCVTDSAELLEKLL